MLVKQLNMNCLTWIISSLINSTLTSMQPKLKCMLCYITGLFCKSFHWAVSWTQETTWNPSSMNSYQFKYSAPLWMMWRILWESSLKLKNNWLEVALKLLNNRATKILGKNNSVAVLHAVLPPYQRKYLNQYVVLVNHTRIACTGTKFILKSIDPLVEGRQND